MRKETENEKRERIFTSYKNDIEKLGAESGKIRFNCVEYVCSFPSIDPYKMAAACVCDGFNIVYDDSSISKKENARKEREVKKLLA